MKSRGNRKSWTYLMLMFGLFLLECESDEVAINNFEDTSMSQIERRYFYRFKGEVVNELPEDYMKKDVYLLKWLKASGFNLEQAVDKIHKMIDWRKQYKMNEIMDEDLSDIESQFPVTMDAVDFIGRPVGTGDIKEWDLRKVVLSGNKAKAIRFVFRMAEIGVRRVMEQHEKNPNVTSGIVILNLDGFNKHQHACLECIAICRSLLVALESYYPFMIWKFFGINTPSSFYPFFNTFASLLKKHVRDVIKLYGPDKKQWQPAILALISAEQLYPQFGGTRQITT